MPDGKPEAVTVTPHLNGIGFQFDVSDRFRRGTSSLPSKPDFMLFSSCYAGTLYECVCHPGPGGLLELREYEMMARDETVHPWFIATRGIIRDAFMEAGITSDSRVLDVGCATGGTMKSLAGMARFTGLDSSPVAARLARDISGAEVVLADATMMPFESASFDGVVACHILEHIQDHDAAVSEMRRVLKPGCPLVALVPCHQFMFNHHDRALHHVRRYSRAEFIALLRRNGFTPSKVAWTNSLVFPVTAVARVLSRLGRDDGPTGSDTTVGLGPLLPLLGAVTGAERLLTRSFPLPFGVGLLVVAR